METHQAQDCRGAPIHPDGAPVSATDFNNTEVAFRDYTDAELSNAYRLFRLLGSPALVQAANNVMLMALRLGLPVGGLIRKTVFRQFCGGEEMNECIAVAEKLYVRNIRAVLDYAIESGESEAELDRFTEEMLRIIDCSAGHRAVAFVSLKPTAVARRSLLEKLHASETPLPDDRSEYERVLRRLDRICSRAADKDIAVTIDAEESWLLKPVDELAVKMMEKYNRSGPVVYLTLQAYLRDRLPFLQNLHRQAVQSGFILAVKPVRGAYWEKEVARAVRTPYPVPVFSNKADTDANYDALLDYAVRHIGAMSVCAATHNEESTLLLTSLMRKAGLPNDDRRVWFSQLYGMSNHISCNLAIRGHNVAKYLPFGPVNKVIPYLVRRTRENTAVEGHMGRELKLLTAERQRRRGRK